MKSSLNSLFRCGIFFELGLLFCALPLQAGQEVVAVKVFGGASNIQARVVETIKESGFFEVTPTLIKGKIFQRTAAKDQALLIVLGHLIISGKDTILLEAVDGMSGATFCYEICGVNQVTNQLRGILSGKLRPVPCQNRGVVALAGRQPSSGRDGELFVKMKKAIVDTKSVVLLNRQVTDDVCAIQDLFLRNGRINKQIHGLMLEPTVMCNVTLDGQGLVIHCGVPLTGVVKNSIRVRVESDIKGVVSLLSE